MTQPLAVSMGEPAGIGPDLILQLYAERSALGLPAFVVYGNAEFMRHRAERLGLDIRVSPFDTVDAADFGRALPVVDLGGALPDRPGQPVPQAAKTVIEAIGAAVRDVRLGRCRGVVTAPIHKATLYAAGFKHPGHTEFLAALCAEDGVPPHPVMMLAHEGLRVVPLTVHVPLADVPRLITEHLIHTTAHAVVKDLKNRFGIEAPKLAITGLNPHAGEDGTIGTEDRDVIAPAIAAMRERGLDVDGPLSADTLFAPAHWREYDCVIAMYHDQALIPIKTLAFDEGVNITLGLPIVRTSPDHGTAFFLAGTGRASPKSLLAALRQADILSKAAAK